MKCRSAHVAARLFLLLCCLTLTWPLWAQNENETVGFQGTHIYESGQFGEDIDVLNGGLSLTIPIGPKYQVNSRLGYQLTLKYNSKVWDSGNYKNPWVSRPLQVLPNNQGSMGIGFTMHFGRIFTDSRFIDNCDSAQYWSCWERSYRWVPPDGSQHEFYLDDATQQSAFIPEGVIEPFNRGTTDPTGATLQFRRRMTSELTYARVSGPGDEYCYGYKDDGVTPETGCYRVETPDGLVYTMAKRVDCANPAVDANDAKDPLKRTYYQSYCGWYTTLIEDSSVGQRVMEGGIGRTLQPYPNHVKITYDRRPGFEHVPERVVDSTGRAITFTNCEWQSGENPDPDALLAPKCKLIPEKVCLGGTTPGQSCQTDGGCGGGGRCETNRYAVATESVAVPSFGGNANVDLDKTATYGFKYELYGIKRANVDYESCCDDSVCTNCTLWNDAVLKLVRVDYPEYIPAPGAPAQQYSMYLGYYNLDPDPSGAGNADYGELTCRTLPIHRVSGHPCGPNATALPDVARFVYSYGYFKYKANYFTSTGKSGKEVNCLPGGIPDSGCNNPAGVGCAPPRSVCSSTTHSGGSGSLPTNGQSRNIANKKIELPVGTVVGTWTYERGGQSLFTNPDQVVVTDPFGNDTVYFYHASQSSGVAGKNGSDPEDGFAPEWRDGMNYRIDYYEGSASTGRRVRAETQEYDADKWPGDPNQAKHAKGNLRVKRSTSTFHDDNGKERAASRENWDGHGHWRIEVESGFGVEQPRTRRTEYWSGKCNSGPLSGKACWSNAECFGGTCVGASDVYNTDLVALSEVLDGTRVLSRTDHEYDSKSRLQTSIARATLPGSIGTPAPAPPLSATQQPADVMTTYTYYPVSGNVHTKQLSSGSGTPTYSINYTWAPAALPSGTCTTVGECGGYLATKAFLDGGAIRWKAIDRDRDGNTGLIMATRGPAGLAGVQTGYSYDSIGRIRQVSPAGEEPTKIDYPSLLETTVTQGNIAGADYIFTRHRYDGLGRSVATEKRSYDPADPTLGTPCQTTKYDIANRVVFKSEWWYAQSGCSPGAAGEVGTTFSFKESDADSSPTDPFGRVRREIPADDVGGDKVKKYKYFGTSSEVTVNGVRGADFSTVFPSVTTFRKDGLGRLVYVEAPFGNRCSVSGAVCSGTCPTGAGVCVATDGGASAIYTYDPLDRLIRVDLNDSSGVVQTRRFGYDGLGHNKWAEHPESGTTVYGDYDALGNLLWLQDASGNRQNFTFDYAGRPLQQTVVPAGGTSRVVAANSYDEAGRGLYSLGQVTTIRSYNEEGALQLTESDYYDGLGGRLSKTEHAFADWSGAKQTTDYTYNPRGQMDTITLPRDLASTHTQLRVRYGYSNGFVVSATEDGPGQVLGRVTYNAAGGLKTVDTPGNGKSIITFDTRNRPSSITAGIWSAGSWTRRDYTTGAYSYDGAGNIFQIGPSDPDGNPATADGTTNRYGYDAANRLVTAHTEFKTTGSPNIYDEVFSYDAFGNMKQRQITTNLSVTETEFFTVDAPQTPITNRIFNRQTQVGGTTASVLDFFYDGNGNLIQGGRRFPGGLDAKRYEYGVLNRLLKVHQLSNPEDGTGLSEIDRFAYDSGGNRIWKLETAAGLKTYYVRDSSGQVLSEFRRVVSATGTPEWLSDYVYLAGRLLTMKENLRPDPPKGLRATQDINDTGNWIVMLTWQQNTEPDRAGYKVYRKREGIDADFVLRASPTSTQYTDAGLPGGHPTGRVILYRVSSRDTTGYESENSSILRVVAGDFTRPAPPVLSGIAGDRRVTLTFSSSDAAGIVGYYIYRGLSPDILSPLNSQLVAETTYVDTNLTNGTIYWYRVLAEDTSGNWSDLSCQSMNQCALSALPKDFVPPAPPRGVTVQPTCGIPGTPDKLRIAWEPNASTDNVASYEIYRNTQPSFAGLSPIASQTSAPFDDDTTLVPGVNYFYAVRALDQSTPTPNRSEFSDIVAGAVRDSTITPQFALQAGLSAQTSDGSVRLKWRTPYPDPGPNKYAIYRKLNAFEECGTYTHVGTVDYAPGSYGYQEYTDGSVPNNAAYDYALTALVGGRESTFSRSILAIPLDRPSSLFQCRGSLTFDPPQGHSDATEVRWVPPVATPYQPVSVSTAGETLGYLKGYHLYHHRICGQNIDGRFEDNSPLREIEVNASSSVDRYLVSEPRMSRVSEQVPPDAVEFENYDPRYVVNECSALSSPSETTQGCPTPTGVQDQSLVFQACNANPNLNCVVPRAVYKIYAEGTWLTVESDWPDYFDPFDATPNNRCDIDTRLKKYDSLPLCSETNTALNPNYVPPPTNVQAAGIGAGKEVTWDAPIVPPNRPPIAGYYVYAIKTYDCGPFGVHNRCFDTSVFQPPVPVKVVGPGEFSVIVTGLIGSGYTFKVVSFDSLGRISDGSGNSPLVAAGFGQSVPVPPPGGVKTVLWTLNDLVNPRGRQGIKIAWYPMTAGNGYRVYRSTNPTGPYCALLSGQPTVPLPPGATVCTTNDAFDNNYSVNAGSSTFYWDRTVDKERIYYYRVTWLKEISSVITETPLEITHQIAARELGYQPNVLPPPQGLRAWADVQTGNLPDKRGIVLNWCPTPVAPADPNLPSVDHYRVYRTGLNDLPYALLAKLSPACLVSGVRCEISSTSACVTQENNPIVGGCSRIEPTSCNDTTGPRCGIVDTTFTCWPQTSDPPFQDDFNYRYRVTAVGSDPASESMPSNENQGWLNYCANESIGPCVPRTSSCFGRRDPDGDGQYLVCGDENARLLTPGTIETWGGEESGQEEGIIASVDERMTPHRVIGQANPYNPPARFVFYHLDHLGSPRVILDGNGAPPQSLHHYLPFGEERPSQTDPTINTRAFTGHERDSESGLDYMLARYYSSSLGRFMAVDPALTITKNLEEPQRWNRYTYSLNNPIKYVDPDGQDIALSTKGSQRAVKKMLVQAAMKPSGRAALQSLDSNHGVTVTYQDSRINTQQQVDQAKQTGAEVTTANTKLVAETKDMQGNTTHYDVETKIDTKAVEQIHPDPTGATTVGHEAVHAEDFAAGKSNEEVEAGEPAADAAGKKVGAEKADMTKRQAKKVVNEMLNN